MAGKVAELTLGGPAEVVPIAGGSHDVFEIRRGGAALIVKLGRGTQGAGLWKEAQVLRFAAEQGIPAATVELIDPLGEICGAPVLVTSRLGVASAAERMQADAQGTSPELFDRCGALLARIHGIALADDRGSALGLTPLDLVYERSRVLGAGEGLVTIGLIARDELERLRGLPLPDRRAAELCHGNYHPVHWRLDALGSLAGVIDWEDASIGDSYADLAMTLAYLRLYAEAANERAFVSGYSRVRPLPERFFETHHPILLGHWLAIAAVWAGEGLYENAQTAIRVLRLSESPLDPRSVR